MQTKRMAVIANRRSYAEELKENLLEYFGDLVEIRTYSTAEVASMEYLEEEVIGIVYPILQKIKPKVKDASVLVAFELMLTRTNMEKLEGLPKDTRALLVNIDHRSCLQTIANIYALGYRDIELIPYCGVEDYDPSIRVAITMDEEQLIPEGIEQVYNIGNREIDINSILDIADKLGIENELRFSKSFAAKKNTLFGSSSVEKILGENEELSDQIHALIQLMEQGIIITDNVGRVVLFNDKVQHLLRGRRQLAKGVPVVDVLTDISMEALEILKGGAPDVQKEFLISQGGQNLIVAINPIRPEAGLGGHVVTVRSFEEVEEYQHGMRTRLSRSSHVAKYSFLDIKGDSQLLAASIEAARRMAKTESSVLITGESGTGKEIFAQSIHNASPRRGYNFVAVNCAAIPENLLESEMFGYEEGSFTGAKRGGKIGYFELAHKGTIFLDEIGEMPLLLQAKLLRVIEERKIIKIGSQKVINVDVRIIAATNRDVYELVRQGKFREDLYYRLNVLPLSIPSLRERGSDVMLLAEHFMKMFRKNLVFTETARRRMESYRWSGNIRELRNVIEYLTNLDKMEIDEADLPPALRREGEAHAGRAAADGGAEHEAVGRAAKEGGTAASEDCGLILQLFLRESGKLEIYLFVLTALEEAAKEGVRMGRPGLAAAARDQGKLFTEAEIREALSRLSDCGFIRQGKGRGGSVITEKGRRLREEIKKTNW